jgi:hypothetical protein
VQYEFSELCSQVRDGETAVVDLPYLSACELITLQDSVHLVEVSCSFKRRDMRVFLDGSGFCGSQLCPQIWLVTEFVREGVAGIYINGYLDSNAM